MTLNDTQKQALESWYDRQAILDEVGKLWKAEEWEALEDFIHRGALLPLGRHDSLPGYMKDQDGKSLFPDNLSPVANLEGWRDAIEVGWKVIETRLGLSHDDVHRAIARIQKDDWESFVKRAEDKKK